MTFKDAVAKEDKISGGTAGRAAAPGFRHPRAGRLGEEGEEADNRYEDGDALDGDEY
jgi:hypothetical protein